MYKFTAAPKIGDQLDIPCFIRRSAQSKEVSDEYKGRRESGYSDSIISSTMFSKLTFLSLFSIATTSASASCLYGSSGYNDRLMRRADGELKYNYRAEGGPLTWGFTDPSYETCQSGTYQSPIILDSSISMANNSPIMNIPNPQGAPINNLGSTAMNVGATGTTIFGGKEYKLLQFHWHTPSEHRIEDEYYPVEMHMVSVFRRFSSSQALTRPPIFLKSQVHQGNGKFSRRSSRLASY